MSAPSVDPALAEALATKLFAAIASNDLDMLRNEVYTPDIQVWHNHERRAQDLKTNLRVLNWLHANVQDKAYTDVRRQPTPTGFVEEHVLRGRTASGESIDVPACLVVTITGDRISHIAEYVDSAHIRALLP